MAIQQETTAHTQTVEIHVNERPVRVSRPRVTGLEIKGSAVAQGVPIEVDFVLSEEIGERRTKTIGDADTVTVNKESRFLAIANDDNS